MSARLGLLALALVAVAATPARAACNAYGCQCARATRTVEKFICNDSSLSMIDQRLGRLHASAAVRAAKEPGSNLESEQRAWENSRNACWKDKDMRACVMRSYETRTAELMARYGLTNGQGPIPFTCEGDGTEIAVTYFTTKPASARIDRGEEKRVALATSTTGDVRYESAKVSFWEEKDGAAHVKWDGQERTCRRKEPAAAADTAANQRSPAAENDAATAKTAANAKPGDAAAAADDTAGADKRADDKTAQAPAQTETP